MKFLGKRALFGTSKAIVPLALGVSALPAKGASLSFVIVDNGKFFVRERLTSTSKAFLLSARDNVACPAKIGKSSRYSFYGGSTIPVTEVIPECKLSEDVFFAWTGSRAPSYAIIKPLKVSSFGRKDAEVDARLRKEFPNTLAGIRVKPKVSMVSGGAPKKEVTIIDYLDETDETSLRHVTFYSFKGSTYRLVEQCTTDFSFFALNDSIYVGFERGPCNSELFSQDIYELSDKGFVPVYTGSIPQ